MEQTFLKINGEGRTTTCAVKPRALHVMSGCLKGQESFAEEFGMQEKVITPSGGQETEIPQGNNV